MTRTQASKPSGPAPRLPMVKLDPGMYGNLGREEVGFLKDQTGIEDEEELKRHVLAVQNKAWDVVDYVCIQNFAFLRLNISRLPAYQGLLKLGKERPGAIFIDYACCFGCDARKVIADGFPIENVVAVDIQKDFWDLGHELYKSAPKTFPVPFVQGDVFDPKHIAPSSPFYSLPTAPPPALATLESLTPLQGHVSVIHVSEFFHLFGKEEQIKAARALASLLSPLPGSMILGYHYSRVVSGELIRPERRDIYDFRPEDWCSLWEGTIFEKGTVEAEAELQDEAFRKPLSSDPAFHLGEGRSPMAWCVRRI